MANRRMFSLDIVDTDNFLEMPVTTQALYFHLGMRADDDGFVSSPKKITKLVNCSEDDLKVLISKGYIIPFKSGIVVIRHWNQNNYIRPDRYKETVLVQEKHQLTLDNNVYELAQVGIPSDIPKVTDWDTQDSIGKDIVRDSIDKDNNIVCSEPDKPTPNPSGILLPLNDRSFYDVPLDKIAMWKETYPAVDVEQELKRMIAWLDSNPTRRKTRKGINRFINSWLSREQDRGGTYKNSEYSQKADVEAALARHRLNIEIPDCPDGPFQ